MSTCNHHRSAAACAKSIHTQLQVQLILMVDIPAVPGRTEGTVAKFQKTCWRTVLSEFMRLAPYRIASSLPLCRLCARRTGLTKPPASWTALLAKALLEIKIRDSCASWARRHARSPLRW